MSPTEGARYRRRRSTHRIGRRVRLGTHDLDVQDDAAAGELLTDGLERTKMSARDENGISAFGYRYMVLTPLCPDSLSVCYDVMLQPEVRP